VRRKLIIAGVIIGGILLLAAIVLFGLYQGTKVEPKWYREAVAVDPVTAREASDEMLQKTTTLISDVKKEGQWEALFTEGQVNGWLAVDLVENHANAVPREVSDLRVAIRPEQVMLSCRFQYGNVRRVVTLTVEPSVPEPNVFALKICKARVGVVPLPLDNILEAVSQAAADADCRLEWRQARGDPVAVITIPPPRDQDDRLIRVETLRLGQGEFYLSGRTQQR